MVKVNIEVPPSPCLACGEPNNSASAPYSDADPKPGDFSMCAYCGHMMAFADDLTMRNLNDEEIKKIAGDPRMIALQAYRPEIKEILTRKRKP